MSNLNGEPEQKMAASTPRSFKVLPGKKVGRWALGLSVIGIGSWVVLPLITGAFATKYPVTNTWVMPAIGTALIDLAAVLNLLCVWPWRERSVLNILAALLVIPMALLFTLIVVGETLMR